MKNNNARNIQRKVEIKNELEHISNKSLVIFTVALISEIVLLFLYSAFSGIGSHLSKLQGFVTTVSIIGFIGFLAMFISAIMLNKKGGKKKIIASLKNWSIVSLIISVCSFLVYPIDITTGFFKIIGLANKGGVLALWLSEKLNEQKVILALIILLAVYVVGMFIYYNIKSNKIKNKK